jgi:hypothetical protein
MIANHLKSFDNTEEAKFHVTSLPIGHTVNGEWMQAPNKRMLVREDTLDYVSVVNDTYHVIQNRELIDTINDQLVGAFGTQIFDGSLDSCQTKVGISERGAATFVYYDFPNISTEIKTNTGHKTDLKFRVILKNTFDGSSKVRLYVGHIDSFCENGMIAGEYSVVSQSHRSALKIKDFTKKFEESLNNYQESTTQYREMAQRTVISSADVMRLFTRLTKKKKEVSMKERYEEEWIDYLNNNDKTKRKDTLAHKLYNRWWNVELPERGDNVYSVMSTLTFYGSHNSEWFPLRKGKGDTANRQTNTGLRLHKRNEQVTQWLQSDAWKQFARVA